MIAPSPRLPGASLSLLQLSLPMTRKHEHRLPPIEEREISNKESRHRTQREIDSAQVSAVHLTTNAFSQGESHLRPLTPQLSTPEKATIHTSRPLLPYPAQPCTITPHHNHATFHDHNVHSNSLQIAHLSTQMAHDNVSLRPGDGLRHLPPAQLHLHQPNHLVRRATVPACAGVLVPDVRPEGPI